MVKRRPYVIAGVLSFIIFFMGFLLGFSLINLQLEELRSWMDRSEMQLRNIELEMIFLSTLGNETFCGYLSSRMEDMGKDISELGKKLVNPRGLTEKSFELIKRRYSISLIQYWLFSKQLSGRCGVNTIDVLYFHETNCEDCISQGYVLDYLVNMDKGKNIHVFALDRKLDEPVIQALVMNYNVTSAPMLIVNEKPYAGFQSRETLSSLFCGMNDELVFC